AARSMPVEPAAAPSASQTEEFETSRPAGLVQEPVEVDPGQAFELGEATDVVESEPVDTEPMPTIDPTAELLGTLTRRKRTPRAAAAPRRTAKTGARKTTTRKKSEG